MLDQRQASAFAQIVLKGIQREYPNHIQHLLNDSTAIRSPKELHPAFYGCYDWHSAVHGHWLLCHLVRLFPQMAEAEASRGAAGQPDSLPSSDRDGLFRRPRAPEFRTYLRLGLGPEAGRGTGCLGRSGGARMAAEPSPAGRN